MDSKPSSIPRCRLLLALVALLAPVCLSAQEDPFNHPYMPLYIGLSYTTESITEGRPESRVLTQTIRDIQQGVSFATYSDLVAVTMETSWPDTSWTDVYYYRLTEGGIETMGNETSTDRTMYSPPMLVMPVDFALGKTWSYSGETIHEHFDPPWLRTSTYSFACSVDRHETITTAAGTFECLYMVFSWAASDTSEGASYSASGSARTWYAGGVGAVKMIFTGTMNGEQVPLETVELIEYDLGTSLLDTTWGRMKSRF